MKKKRILVFADFLFPEYLGGSARLASNLNEALKDSGCEVTCITRRSAGNYSSNYKVQRSYRVIYTNDFKALLNILFLNRWDLVISHHFSLGLFAYLFNKRINSFYFFHGPVHLERKSRGGGNIGALLRRIAEYIVLSRHNKIFCLSNYMKEYVPKLLQDKVIVTGALHNTKIPNDFTLKHFTVNPVRLLTVRRLTARTGVLELCKIVEQLGSELTLTVVGNGELFDSLVELNISNVRVFGQVSDEKLDQLYKQADLVILPSLELEGFGLIIIESLARGTPVLASNCAGGGADFLSSISSDFIYNLSCDPPNFMKRVYGAINAYEDKEIRKRLYDRINDFKMSEFINKYISNEKQ